MDNLVIDIGNSSAKLAIFRQGRLVEAVRDDGTMLGQLPALCARYDVGRALLSTVTPLTEEAETCLRSLPVSPVRLDGQTPLPIRLCYHTPRTIGPDRIAAVVGAWVRCPKRNLLVMDAGTCLTVDFLDAGGNYLGGNIAPGRAMRFQALHAFTARLPLVGPDGEMPELGHTTETALRAGVIRGMEYEMEGYIRRFRQKYPDLLVFLTGGDEFSFDTSLKNIIFADKFLVLIGLNCIVEYLEQNKSGIR